ncbi:hypothetical protein LG954_10510, partial [Bifidobacterium longum subsp. infantis]|nr:hypothetical protein [Bifidobacterium longum subsp. infantis]
LFNNDKNSPLFTILPLPFFQVKKKKKESYCSLKKDPSLLYESLLVSPNIASVFTEISSFQ